MYLPSLGLSSAGCALVVLGLAAAVGYWVGVVPPHWPKAGWIRALIALAAWVAAFEVARRVFSSQIPGSCHTVGDLARLVTPVATRAEVLAEQSANGDVQAKVIELVSKRLNVPIEKITLSSRFVQDLGGG